MTTATQYDFEDVKRKIEQIPKEEWKYENISGEMWYKHVTHFGSIVIGYGNERHYIHLLDRNSKLITHYGPNNPQEGNNYCSQDFIASFFEAMKNNDIIQRHSQRGEDISKLEEWLQE